MTLTWRPHVGRVREVIRRCPEHGITLHPGKFVFGMPSVSYCGFKLSADRWLSGRRPPRQGAPLVPGLHQPHRCTVVLRPGPAIPGLLAKPDYHARPHSCSVIAVAKVSIHVLDPGATPGGFPTSDPGTHHPRILANYKPGLPLQLETDAAQSKGLGMALWQQQPSGEWRILQCGSRHVTPAESRYSATEVELLAVMWAVHKAHLYLADADFELVVDYRPLIPILNSKSLDELPSPHLVRSKEKLALYQLTAMWRPGIEHKIVDCFSRYPVDDPDVDNEQADVEEIAHIHAMLFQAKRDHTNDDRILALLENPHLTRLKTEANRDP